MTTEPSVGRPSVGWPSIGWLGTGRMGTVMAGRLIDGGRSLTVWNRTPAKTAPLAARGARVAGSITGLAGCDVVFVMVSGPADLEQVTLGEGGLLTGERRPGILIDCSTVSEAASARIRGAATAAGVSFLAAPVCGNPDVFADGQGSFIVSGPAQTFQAVRPHLEQIAGKVTYVGEQEQARLVKLAHNLYLGMMVQSLVEVVTLAEKAGTSREAFLEFFNGSALVSPWIRRRSPELVDQQLNLTFTNELLRKDFDLGLGAARDLEVPMPAASAVYQIIQSAIGNGLRHEDFLSLYEHQARGAGLADARTALHPGTG
ncbi:MAG TPA: NAD(P)-dependent oxidoreductase [Streptosporangiaceae bacterium]|nr:NAD(P)-dependent oxidoreductase [Streptosporangiaceae bacterium]